MTATQIRTDAASIGAADQDEPEPPAGPTVDLDDTTGSCTPQSIEAVCRWSVKAAIEAGALRGAVRVRLLDDAAMSSAHAKHLADPSVTDVITFDLSHGTSAKGSPIDIDLLVCIDEARRQSDLRGHALEHELVLYILHGMLHCLGYDDHTEHDANIMHAREDEILTSIGLGAAFAPAHRDLPNQE